MLSLLSKKNIFLSLFALLFCVQCSGGSGSPSQRAEFNPLDVSILRANDKLTFISTNHTTGSTQILIINMQSKTLATASLSVSGKTDSGFGTNVAETAPTSITWAATNLSNTYTLTFKGKSIVGNHDIEIQTDVSLHVDSTETNTNTGIVTIEGKMAETSSRVPSFLAAPFASPYKQTDELRLSIKPRSSAD